MKLVPRWEALAAAATLALTCWFVDGIGRDTAALEAAALQRRSELDELLRLERVIRRLAADDPVDELRAELDGMRFPALFPGRRVALTVQPGGAGFLLTLDDASSAESCAPR